MGKQIILRLNHGGDCSVNAEKYDDLPTPIFRIQMLEAMRSGYMG